MKKAVLFDLDGTLVDTIVDLGATIDKIMIHYGVAPHYTHADYKKMVGDGVAVLFERALVGIDVVAEEETIGRLFNEIYSQTLFNHASVYEGIEELLNWLREQGYALAVVSNKPNENTLQTIHHFFAPGTFDCIVGQVAGVPRKPDPAQVNVALSRMRVEAENAVFIGDSNTDIMTAAASNLISIGVDWGFRGEKELLAQGADYIAYTPSDIKKILTKL